MKKQTLVHVIVKELLIHNVYDDFLWNALHNNASELLYYVIVASCLQNTLSTCVKWIN